MRINWCLAVVASQMLLVAGCGTMTSTAPSTTVQPLTGAGLVTISGTKLLRDGMAWVPRAVQLNAFVAAPSVQTGEYLAAYQNYSASELLAIKAWGADTVRFQVGQPELDPQSGLETTAFTSAFQAAVTLARTDGLNVILSVQDQSQTGEPSPSSLPDAGTIRAWTTLTGMFNNDIGIVYEIFNEPEGSNTTANWTAWQTAHQAVLTQIRSSGVTNVILADGLHGALTLAGAPTLSDPLNATGYAVHPFFFSSSGYETTADFDTNFGTFAATNVVVATEWSTRTDYYCASTTPATSQTLLTYLAGKGIGVTGFAYDDPGYGGNQGYNGMIVSDYAGTPSTFAGGTRTCGQFGFGPGVMLQGYFKTGTVPAP